MADDRHLRRPFPAAPGPVGAAPARPSPRPRVASSRRDRDEPEATTTTTQAAAAAAAARTTPVATAVQVHGDHPLAVVPPEADAPSSSARAGRHFGTLALVLALLCLGTAAGAGLLLWQRLNPSYVDTSVLTAARSGVEALYAYDYHQDSEGSVERARRPHRGCGAMRGRPLAGRDPRHHEQVSATTSYEVVDVGLQQINEAQDTATLVVFGKYVVKSTTSGRAGPEGLRVRGEPRRRPVLRPDGAGRRGPRRRRPEDQQADAAHHQLIGVDRRGVAVPPEAFGWHHGRCTAPGPRVCTGAGPRIVAPVASRPPTWTAPVRAGRVSCCAAL